MDSNGWKIKNISVEGLVNSHNLFWELYPSVNILGAPNGSGKSSLLHALAMILHTTKNQGVIDEEATIHCNTIFKTLKVECVSGAELILNRTVKSRQEQVKKIISQKVVYQTSEEISYNGRCNLPENVKDALFANNIIYINSLENTVFNVSRLVNIEVNKQSPSKTILDMQLENARSMRNQLFAQQMTVAMQNGEEEEVNKLRGLFGRFEEAVEHFMPQYKISDTSKLLFELKSDNSIRIPYYRLSSGEKQLLYLLLTVCNTLEEDTILLLDEAEVGMHIDWRKILLRELRTINPNMQIIAATHSPSLITGWHENVREISQLYTD